MSRNGLTDLERSVGKLLIGRLSGADLDDDMADALESGIVSGITLFKENAQSVEQLLSLCASIYRHYEGIPLIAVDQEGGAVQRFDHILTAVPSPMSLAASPKFNAVREVVALSCRQLQLLGINCLLAPTLDIASNPHNPVIGTRSFGSNPETVIRFGSLVATTAARFGLMAVGKHFPGHGATDEDSHTALAVNRSDGRLLWARDLLPFRGCKDLLPAIMVGHIWLPGVDSEAIPATMSSNVITALLREYLQFDRLVMTDDLFMNAITAKWGVEEAAIRSVAAGAQQLLPLGSPAQVRAVHAALMAAVTSGRISEQQVADAAAAVERSRAELSPPCVLDRLEEAAAELKRLSSADRQLCLEVATSSICVLRGAAPVISEGKWLLLVPEHPRYCLPLPAALGQAVEKLGLVGKVELLIKRYPLDPTDDECATIAAEAGQNNCLFLTFRTLNNPGQSRLGAALAQSDKERVTVACDVPYDLIGLAAWDNCLATFDPSDLSMEALANVLTGSNQAQGICPVSLTAR